LPRENKNKNLTAFDRGYIKGLVDLTLSKLGGGHFGHFSSFGGTFWSFLVAFQ
jgi:hypothetical protein